MRAFGRAQSWCLAGLCLILAVACKGKPQRADQIKEGDAFLAKKDYNGAAASYGAAARNGPPDGQLFRKEADAYLQARRVRMASNAAAHAADLLPDDPNIQLLAARLMLAERRFGE